MILPRRISTAIELDFPDEDRRDYPWLNQHTRIYHLAGKLGEGAFATTYEGHPCDPTGQPILDVRIVVKIPKLDRIGRDGKKRFDDDIHARMGYIRKKNLQEFSHVRRRLLGCTHANPIIDLVTLHEAGFDLPATIQPFLPKAVDLDEWLFARRLCPHVLERGPDRLLLTKWSGIADRAQWVTTALQIADALKDIHLRRVTHGDIHPGNTFLGLHEPYATILIDFGDAFVATPNRNWRPRKKNTYLAPERSGPRSPLNEQVDVYSFGVLLLYLATGVEREFPLDHPPALHRSYIYDQIRNANPLLIQNEPRILDVIGQSTARDPANRPRTIDIYDDLWNIAVSIDASLHSKTIPNAIKLRKNPCKSFYSKHL